MDFVTFDIAKKLKEKGFNAECHAYYEPLKHCLNLSRVFKTNSLAENYNCIAAPTIYQVLKWLREKKNIEVVASFSYRDRVWGYQVGDMTLSEDSILAYDYSFPTYEEAALAGIEYVINNLI